jgi:hypothetical protein
MFRYIVMVLTSEGEPHERITRRPGTPAAQRK